MCFHVTLKNGIFLSLLSLQHCCTCVLALFCAVAEGPSSVVFLRFTITEEPPSFEALEALVSYDNVSQQPLVWTLELKIGRESVIDCVD